MTQKQLKLMSMEELDKLRRFETDETLRRAASDHLAKREHEAFAKGKPTGLQIFRRQHYPV